MPSEAMLKISEIYKKKHNSCINNHSPNISPVSKIFSLCLQQNSLCFPCLEKVRSKFPAFPVWWPPCKLLCSFRGGATQKWTCLQKSAKIWWCVVLIYCETERTAFHQLSHYTPQILRESHKWLLTDKLCVSVATSDR